MSMFGSKREPIAPMPLPAELGELKKPVPVEYTPPNLRPDGSSRDAVIEAAREHDRQEQRIAELMDLLHRAHAGVEAASHQIDQLKLALAEERNHVASYKAERDEAVENRANAVAILSNIIAIIERGVDVGDVPRKRGRNGKRDVLIVADGTGGGSAPPSSQGTAGNNASIPNRGGVGSVPDEEGSRE